MAKRAQDRSHGQSVGSRSGPSTLALLACLTVFAPPSWAADKCGDTACPSEQWTFAGGPYVVTCEVRVPPGCALTIDAGAEVRFQAGTRLLVEGDLEANGIAGSEVSFTSDAVLPAVGDWGGLYLQTGSGNSIEYATIDYAGNAIFLNATAATLDQVTATNNMRGLYVYGNATVDVNGLTARYNDVGLYVNRGNSTVTITGSTLTDNNQYGLSVDGYLSQYAPDVTLTASSIHSNLGAYDYHTDAYANAAESVLLARGNWWGTTDTTTISSRIHDYRTTTNVPLVDWCGWLDGPAGSVERDVECPDLMICGETADWSVTVRPYLLVSDLIICPTGTLDVGPGVEVRSVSTSPRMDFANYGTLNVHGTPTERTRFTSDSAVPAIGDWSGLYQFAGSSSSIAHAAVDHAENAVYVNAGSAVLDQVEATDSARGLYVYGNALVDVSGLTARYNEVGLYVNRGNSTVTVTGSTLTDNTQYGVSMNGYYSQYAPNVTLTASSIHSNLGAYDYHTDAYANAAESVLLARGNWWGTTDTTTISSRIHDYRTTTNVPLVDWCGWLDGRAGSVERDVECPDLMICGETADWSVTARPYLLVSDLIICATGSLDVGPGVEVRSVSTSPRMDFANYGALNVHGTPTERTRFTSDSAVPAIGDWSGLYQFAGSSSSIAHVAVDHAENAVYVNAGSAALDHVEATHSTRGLYVYGNAVVDANGLTARHNEIGIYVNRGNSTVTVAGSTLTDNTQYGVSMNGYYSQYAPNVTVTASSIHSNLGAYDVYTLNFVNPATKHVWFLDNWWNTSSGAQIADRIRDYSDHQGSPRVHFSAYGATCDAALGRDLDLDGLGDFQDNCPVERNATQVDGDGDGMGDACDPEPGTAPTGLCNGVDDVLDGYVDADGDGWGDPCDFQPTREDCYPGAPEICDGRDNDGDGQFVLDELGDADMDEGLTCADCDETDPTVNTCSCEDCDNTFDDDCDSLVDGADSDCEESPLCIYLVAGAGDPDLELDDGACGTASPGGPYDVVTGNVTELRIVGGSVDLGATQCVAGAWTWDRVTELARNVNPACNDQLTYFLARASGAVDFGTASGGELRDVMTPDPPCP